MGDLEATAALVLRQSLWCLPVIGGGDDPLLLEGTRARDLWRGEDYGELGVAWRMQASLDDGVTWRAFETMWDGEDEFPVMIDRVTESECR